MGHCRMHLRRSTQLSSCQMSWDMEPWVWKQVDVTNGPEPGFMLQRSNSRTIVRDSGQWNGCEVDLATMRQPGDTFTPVGSFSVRHLFEQSQHSQICFRRCHVQFAVFVRDILWRASRNAWFQSRESSQTYQCLRYDCPDNGQKSETVYVKYELFPCKGFEQSLQNLDITS
jgi:hypothetical protein